MTRRIATTAISTVFVLLCLPSTVFAAGSCIPAPSDLVTPGALTIGIATGVPPMAYMEGNTPTGFDVEMGESLAKAMCLKPTLINMPFAGLLPGIDAKKFDLLSASAGITPARKEVFDMIPYYVGGIRLVALKKSGLNFASEYDTCGHSVSTKAGSVEAHALEKVKAQCPADKPMTLSVFPSDNEAMQQLYKGVVEASFLDWPIAAYTMSKDERIAPASPIISGDGPNTPRHIDGLVVRKGNTAMSTAVSAALKQMISDGTYEKLLAKYSMSSGDIRSVK